MYEMTTLYNGTRIRDDHTTFGKVVASINAKITVTGDVLWTAPADGLEVKAGDKWLRVTYENSTGWVALIHKGFPICKDFKEIAEPDPPPVDTPESIDPTETFPEYFILEAPTGERKRYDRSTF